MKYRKIEEQENINLQLKNNKKVQKVKETGITLIALVVTIVLLLILVGVTISQITGENGLIRKAKEAVERYKNATEEEQIQLGQLEQYVSDFSIVGGEEGEKATISIKSLELTGNTAEQQVIIKVTVIGETSGIEYKINSEEEWTQRKNEGTEKEEIEGEKETEYTHTFEGLEIGKSYYVRVKVYDTEGKYEEAISDVVTLGYIMTAEDKDVLETKTYIGKTGTKSTGSMPNNGEVNEIIEVGETYMMKEGYYSGGTITTGTKKIEELEKRVAELEKQNTYSEEEIRIGTWINGKPLYRKVIYFRNLTYTGEQFTRKLEIQNIENYCNCEVYHIYIDVGGFESYRAVSNGYYLDWYINDNCIHIDNKIYNIKNFDYMVIIEYTKTTD